MIKTSTPELKLTGTLKNSNENHLHSEEFSPSAGTINALLNYSRSLEIKRSKFIDLVEIVKS
jgi:hypothetical protein